MLISIKIDLLAAITIFGGARRRIPLALLPGSTSLHIAADTSH
jgi:hypothetical protein